MARLRSALFAFAGTAARTSFVTSVKRRGTVTFTAEPFSSAARDAAT